MVQKKDRKGVGAMNILMIPPLCNLQLNFSSLPLAFVDQFITSERPIQEVKIKMKWLNCT